jgi:hypothetical protein
MLENDSAYPNIALISLARIKGHVSMIVRFCLHPTEPLVYDWKKFRIFNTYVLFVTESHNSPYEI